MVNTTDDIHIALLLMCKNEHKRIGVTLESVVGTVKSIVCYDTGSTDDTIDIITNFCKKHDIILRLKQGEFEDFSTSRNVSLDFADTFEDIDYLLLLDVNDELRGGEKLIEEAKKWKDKEDNSGFLLCQEWYSGQLDKYFNMRFVKPRCNWRYKGVVHEYMHQDGGNKNVVRFPDNIVLYQDRTLDDDKSAKRFVRDKKLLVQEYEKDPEEPRTLFYLAQTCACLNEPSEAYYYYKLRTKLKGFWEEVFQSYFRCGVNAELMKHPWHDCMSWYMKAFEYSQRIEPVLKIVEYYTTIKNWHLAYTFAVLACNLEYPTNCILFVDKRAYDYKRWHLMGIVGWYYKRYEEGELACRRAIEYSENNGFKNQVDYDNLKFYTDRRAEMSGNNSNNINYSNFTKKQFISMKVEELKKSNPRFTVKKLTSMANKEWKNRNVK